MTRDLTIKSVQPIVLDINKIEILDTKVRSSDSEVPFDVSYGPHNQSYHITLKRPISNVDTLDVHLVFNGVLTDTMQGVYRGEYKDSNSDAPQNYVSTQFSPTDARKAFPCFDRPDKKAVFNISLVRPLSLGTYLSNMRHVSTG